MEYHRICLDNMCRICTNRAQKCHEIKDKRSVIYTQRYADEIYILFGVDVHDDQDMVHPKKMCDQCYQVLQNSKKRGENGEMNLSGSYGEYKDKVFNLNKLWIPHIDNRKVCNEYQRQSRPGCHKKPSELEI